MMHGHTYIKMEMCILYRSNILDCKNACELFLKGGKKSKVLLISI